MRPTPIALRNGQTNKPRKIHNYVFILGMFMCLAAHVVLYYFAQAATELWAEYELRLSSLSQIMLSYGDWLKTGFDFFPLIPGIIPIMVAIFISSLIMIVMYRDKTMLHLMFGVLLLGVSAFLVYAFITPYFELLSHIGEL